MILIKLAYVDTSTVDEGNPIKYPRIYCWQCATNLGLDSNSILLALNVSCTLGCLPREVNKHPLEVEIFKRAKLPFVHSRRRTMPTCWFVIIFLLHLFPLRDERTMTFPKWYRRFEGQLLYRYARLWKISMLQAILFTPYIMICRLGIWVTQAQYENIWPSLWPR